MMARLLSGAKRSVSLISFTEYRNGETNEINPVRGHFLRRMKGDARLSFLFSFSPRPPGRARAITDLPRTPPHPTAARHPADCPSEGTLHEAALLPVAVRGRLAAPPPDRVRAGPGEGRRDHRRARAS